MMNIKDFILMVLAAYLGLLGTVLVVFNTERFFKTELAITILLIISAIIGLKKIYDDAGAAYAYTTVFFSVLLFNTLILNYITAVDFSIFLIMLLSGLSGLALSLYSVGKKSMRKVALRDAEMNEMRQGIPSFMPQVYNIMRESEIRETSPKGIGVQSKDDSDTAAKKKATKKATAKKKATVRVDKKATAKKKANAEKLKVKKATAKKEDTKKKRAATISTVASKAS